MKPCIAVLYGGVSGEREISLVSGRNVANALSEEFEVELFDLKSEKLPRHLSPINTIVFPALHGGFGEDGRLQMLLEDRGITYVGSDAASSSLCIDKNKTKEIFRAAGIPVLPHVCFDPSALLPLDQIKALGGPFVLKPNADGSSLGLHLIDGLSDLNDLLPKLKPGRWLIEKCIHYREFTVGVLNGQALGVVEIKPKHDAFYDFSHKYTPGAVDFYFPARIDEICSLKMRQLSELAYRSCKCRDFARVDLLMDEKENLYFLEINTIPGLTPNSLLPRSAQCEGYDFKQLCMALVQPALNRYTNQNLPNLLMQ